MDECQIIISLIEAIETAIDAGDWRVDGACDPDLDIGRAKHFLRCRGYMENCIDGSWFKD